MAERSLRGTRLGSYNLQSEEGVVLADRQRVSFLCTNCEHRSDLVFAAEAEVPDQWECSACGYPAGRLGGDATVTEVQPPAPTGRTPWEMLLERRTIAELEEILDERLKWLRSRRGEDSAA